MDSMDDDVNLQQKDYRKKRDAFLQTFQKPTQIYRYLKHRHDESPIFLHRTLAYLPGRMSRSHQSRKTIILDDLINAKMNKTKPFHNDTPANGNNRHTTTAANAADGHNCQSLNHHSSPRHHNHHNLSINGAHQALSVSSENTNNNNHISRSNHQSNHHRLSYHNGDDSQDNGKSIYFNFLSSKSIRQLTKTKSFACPWCFVNCFDLEPLIMHLKLCHSRFTFTHQTVTKGYRIDIRLNENYDGSYSGYRYPGHDLLTDFKFSYSQAPTRRTPFTQTIFVRSQRYLPRSRSSCLGAPSLINDCAREEDSYDQPLQERLFYHTSTCLPIKADEADLDSEEDNDPSWLRERTQLMIDEFVDVNDGEKQMLKLWNLHIMQNRRYIADYQMPDACREFIAEQGDQIINKKLFGNLILHLANLYEFGLITPQVMLECMRTMHAKRRARKPAIKSEHGERLGSPPRKKAAHANNHITRTPTNSSCAETQH